MAGLGVCSYGAANCGLGEPSDPTSVPTAKATLCRWLDPVTRDYQIDTSTGQLRQMSGVMQRVILLVCTTLGTVAPIPTMGTKWPKKITGTFEADMDAEIRRVLRPLTDEERVMRIDALTVTRGASRAAVELRYFDFQTGKSEKVSVAQ